MKPVTKKILFFAGIGVDLAITIFLMVVAIIMLSTMPSSFDLTYQPDNVIAANGPFIGWLQLHPTAYFWTCVFPLILLLIANIVFLVLYVKKAGKAKAQLADLSEEQKAALRAELLKDVKSEDNKSEEKK